MSANLLDSADAQKNVYFGYIYPLDDLSGNLDVSVCFRCISHPKDPYGGSDGYPRCICNYYMYYISVYYMYYISVYYHCSYYSRDLSGTPDDYSGGSHCV